MKIITLTNSFHNTEVRVRGPWHDAAEAWFEIQAAVDGTNNPTQAAKRRLKRVQKALCGFSDCMCGIVR